MKTTKSGSRFLFVVIAFWIAAGLALRFFQVWIHAFPGIFIVPLWSLAGAALLGVTFWRLRKRGLRRDLLLAAAMVVICWSVLYFAGGPVTWAGTKWRFAGLKPGYEDLIAELQVDPREAGSEWRSAELGYYIVSPGPPLRVGFPWPGGILDNWCGAVYDPTGFVMEANRFRRDWSNWDDPELADVKTVFPAEDLVGCRPLEGPFYFCWFT